MIKKPLHSKVKKYIYTIPLLLITVFSCFTPTTTKGIVSSFDSFNTAIYNAMQTVTDGTIQSVVINGTTHSVTSNSQYKPGAGSGYIEFRTNTVNTQSGSTASNIFSTSGIIIFRFKIYLSWAFSNMYDCKISSNKQDGGAYHDSFYIMSTNDYIYVFYTPSMVELNSPTVKFYVRFYYKNNVASDNFQLGSTSYRILGIQPNIDTLSFFYLCRINRVLTNFSDNYSGGTGGSVDLQPILDKLNIIESINDESRQNIINVYNELITANQHLADIVDLNNQTVNLLTNINNALYDSTDGVSWLQKIYLALVGDENSEFNQTSQELNNQLTNGSNTLSNVSSQTNEYLVVPYRNLFNDLSDKFHFIKSVNDNVFSSLSGNVQTPYLQYLFYFGLTILVFVFIGGLF